MKLWDQRIIGNGFFTYNGHKDNIWIACGTVLLVSSLDQIYCGECASPVPTKNGMFQGSIYWCHVIFPFNSQSWLIYIYLCSPVWECKTPKTKTSPTYPWYPFPWWWLGVPPTKNPNPWKQKEIVEVNMIERDGPTAERIVFGPMAVKGIIMRSVDEYPIDVLFHYHTMGRWYIYGYPPLCPSVTMYPLRVCNGMKACDCRYGITAVCDASTSLVGYPGYPIAPRV